MSPQSGETTLLKGPETTTDQRIDQGETTARAGSPLRGRTKEEVGGKSSTPSLVDSPAMETPTTPERSTSELYIR